MSHARLITILNQEYKNDASSTKQQDEDELPTPNSKLIKDSLSPRPSEQDTPSPVPAKDENDRNLSLIIPAKEDIDVSFIPPEKKEDNDNEEHDAAEENEPPGNILLKQAIMILKDALLIDEALKTHPNVDHIKKYIAKLNLVGLKRDFNTYKTIAHSKTELLIEEAKFLLKAAYEYGNDDAFELLEILNTTRLSSALRTFYASEKLLSPKHQHHAAKMKQLENLLTSEAVANPEGNLDKIDDYIDSPKL